MPRVTITVPEKNAQPYRFQLNREVVFLGRGDENDIVIDSGSVSVKHAEMRRIKGGYELRDSGSTNGIKLDGVRYEVIPLKSGTTVHMGDVAFDFLLADEELATLASELSSEPATVPEKSYDSLPVLEKAQEPMPAPKEADVEESSSRQPAPQRENYAPEPVSGGSGIGAFIILVILAAAAFAAGLAIRYQKETGGGSLIEAIRAKHFSDKAAPAPGEPASR